MKLVLLIRSLLLLGNMLKLKFNFESIQVKSLLDEVLFYRAAQWSNLCEAYKHCSKQFIILQSNSISLFWSFTRKRANVVLLLGHWSMRSFEPQGSQLKRDDRLIRRRGSCRGLYLEMGSWAYKLILERVAQIDGSFCPEEQSSRSSGCHSYPKGHDTAFLAMNIHFHSECVWQHSRTGLRLFPGGTGISLRLHGDIISRFDFFICDIHLCG